MMPNLILDLLVDRVDLVDEGANSQAFIKLYKRKETDSDMLFEDILAKMKPEHAEVIREEVAKAKSEVPEETTDALNNLQEEKNTVEEELAKAKTQLEEQEIAKNKGSEPDFETVLKSLDPSVQEVFKSLKAQKDAAEAVAKQAAEKQIQDEAIAKAKELKSLPVEEDKLVEVMKSVSPEIFEILKAANKAVEDGGIFEEVGKSKTDGSNAADAWTQIEKKAKDIEEAEKITSAQAIAKAIKQNPDLYREYLKGGNE